MNGVILKRLRGVGVLAILFLSVPAFGQNLSRLVSEHNVLKAREWEYKKKVSYESVVGIPYYTNDYVKCVVYAHSRDSITLDLRFDLFINEMEYRQNEILMWLDKEQIKGLKYGAEKVTVAEIAGETDPAYLFVVEDGPYSLLLRKSVAFRDTEPPRAYTDPLPQRFEPEDDVYYIKNGNFPAQPVMSKKQLDDIVVGKPGAVEFVKKQKTKPAKEKDLIKLVQFLNML